MKPYFIDKDFKSKDDKAAKDFAYNVQQNKKALFYEFLGECLPAEGVDYLVKFDFSNDGSGKVSVSLTGLTPLGIAFVNTACDSFISIRTAEEAILSSDIGKRFEEIIDEQDRERTATL